ncbi:hypothetical protein LMB95_03100 [Limosilactobacillus reuteri]|nr:hypothetical protein [Limosilactobacillus reuteri]
MQTTRLTGGYDFSNLILQTAKQKKTTVLCYPHNYLGCLRKDIFLMTNDINFWTGIKDPYLITYTVILGVTSNITGYPIKKSSNGYSISLQI